MHLTGITMRGFKSFADRTRLPFERGLVAVVGPNGAGKSNLIDALMWGLGTLSAKTLRADKMEDVIFVGTPSRPALGMASVSLNFDNSLNAFPVDVAEVSIGRTLYRDGASEYTLNGVSCRLLDIQEMMAEAGVGRELHAVVAQGQVDEIVNASGDALRLAIEEAAGITKHRRRAEKAMRKILDVEANLQRVADVVSEQRKQLRPLRAHAEAAERHASATTEFERASIALASAEFSALRSERSRANDEREQLAVATDALKSELEIARAKRTTCESELREARSSGGDLRGGLDHLRTAQAAALRAVLLLREGSGIVAESQAERVTILRKLDEQTRSELLEIDSSIADLEVEERRVRGLAESAARVTESAQTQARAAAETHTQAQAEIRGLHLQAERARQDAEAAQQRQDAAQKSATEQRTQSETVAEQIDELDAELGKGSMHLQRLQDERRKIEASIDAADLQQRSALDRKAVISGRLEALVCTRDLVETRRSQAKSLTGQAGVRGVLADFIKPRSGYEAAINAILQDVADALIVASGSLVEAIELAEKTQSDVKFLPTLQPATQPAAPPMATRLASLIDSPDWLRPTIEFLLASTWLVEDDEAATSFAMSDPSATVVTKAGRIIRAKGISRPAIATHQPVIGLDAVIDEATAELETWTQKIASSSQQRELLGRKVSSANSEIEQIQSRVAELEGRIAAAADRLRDLGAAQRAFEIESDLAAADHRSKLEVHSQTLTQAESLNAQLPALEASRDATIESAEAAVVKLGLAAADPTAGLGELRVKRAQLQERLMNASERLHEATSAFERAENYDPDDLGAAELALRATELLTERVNEEVKQYADVEATLQSQQAELEQQTTRAELEITALEPRLRHLSESIVRCDTLAEQAGTRLAELGVRPSEVVDDPNANIDELRIARAKLEAELKRIGPVSPFASTEIAELTERLEFTESQMEDLRSSKRDLVRLVRATEARMRDMLEVAAIDANVKFQEVVAVLFPEGGGRLTVNPDEHGDLLNGHVEIEVRLGRKGHRKLGFLSGGERALAGLAFLFALHLARPTPFLVLDEVDAPLDDANLERFLRLLDSLRTATQVLVVTHQKKTMAHADRLVGVVLNPDGTSSVVSQSLDNYALTQTA